MSLVNRITTGVKWSSISQVGRQSIQLITTIILTRLLSPSDFGLVGMGAVVTGFVALFHDLGTSAAVIQKKVVSEVFLSSIFWVNASFGLLVAVALFVCAPFAANLYHEPRVTLILQILSLSFLVFGLSIVQQAILERELAFEKLAKIEIAASASSSLVCIGAALLGAKVWSLVFQALMFAFVTTALLWTSSDWRPKAFFRWREVMSVSHFSLNLTGFNIFNYFARNVDYILIGRFLGAQSLGYYMMAYRVMLYPIQAISAVVGRVMLPAYSQIREDEPRFRRIYLKVVGTIALITFPMMIGLWGLADQFLLAVLGAQWKPVILLLLILAPVGLLQSIITTVGTIYQAKGRADLMFRVGIATGSITILAFAIGLQWGIAGVASAYAITTILCLYPNFIIPFRLIGLRFSEFGRVMIPIFVMGLSMLVLIKAGLLGLGRMGLTEPWVQLAVGVLLGGSSYLIFVLRFQRELLNEFLTLLPAGRFWSSASR
jgi:O-antigen/teichoic acid export membrane protein